MEKLLCQVPSAAPQACLKPCWADTSSSVVATQRLTSGAKVAAGAVQIVGLSMERDISPLSLGQSDEILSGILFSKFEQKT